MRVHSCQTEDLQQHLDAAAAPEAGPAPALVEAIRSELTARRVTTQTSLARAVQRLLGPVIAVSGEEVTQVLDEMAREGDLSSASGGRIAAAPLRIVVLTDQYWALHGTLPTARLSSVLPECKVTGGIRRLIEADARRAGGVRDAVVQSGGLELSLERWTGIDRTPPADNAWLSSMDDRLAWQGDTVPPDGTEEEWRRYHADPAVSSQRLRWVKAKGKTRGFLWRRWDERGWYAYAWSDGSVPADGKSARLTRDEATRTMFALDRQAEASLTFPYSESRKGVKVVLGAFLPRAEYRYLVAVSISAEGRESGNYTVRQELWENLRQTLCGRLAIEFSSSRDPE